MNFKQLSKGFRKLPDFKGKRRIARWLLSKKNKNITISGKYELKYQIPNIIDSIGFDLLINGIYEMELINNLNKALKNAGIFFDVGANIGAISIPIAKLNPHVQVYSIEASPNIYKYLDFNINVNKITNITPVNIGLSDQDKSGVDFFSPSEEFGKGSFSPVFTQVPEVIEAISIDSLIVKLGINKIDVMKIDVEGYEYQVLQGGAKLLGSSNKPDMIFMEYVDWAESAAKNKKGAAQELLISFGYKLFELKNFHFNNPDKGVLVEPLISRCGIIVAIK